MKKIESMPKNIKMFSNHLKYILSSILIMSSVLIYAQNEEQRSKFCEKTYEMKRSNGADEYYELIYNDHSNTMLLSSCESRAGDIFIPLDMDGDGDFDNQFQKEKACKVRSKSDLIYVYCSSQGDDRLEIYQHGDSYFLEVITWYDDNERITWVGEIINYRPCD